MVQISEKRVYELPAIERFMHGINPTKEEDVFLVFSMIDPEDRSLFVQVQNVLKRDYKIQKKNSNKLWNKYQERYQWKAMIKGNDFKHKEQEFMISSTGIYKIETSIDKIGNPHESKSPLWLWDSFNIMKILSDDSTNTDRYDFEYNGKIYKNKEFKQMVEIMSPFSLMSRNNKQILGPLVYAYMKQYKIDQIKYSQICGFTKDGWRLPDNYRINFNDGIQEKIGICIEKMSLMEIDKTLAIQNMKNLYETMHVDNKDLIFAVGTIAPFLYSLKKTVDLHPFFCFYSNLNQTGKSHSAILISKKFWNNMEEGVEVYNKDNFDSVSRVGDYNSVSTFPTVIDDCGDLSDEIKNIIKSSITQDTNFQRKDKNQQLKINKPYCTSMIFTFNNIPDLFEGVPILSRGCFIPLDKQLLFEDVEEYKKVVGKIPNGYFGKYIYEYTKKWNVDNLIEIYNKQKSFSKDNRKNTIYRLVKTGSVLFEKIFGIPLNVEKIKEYIEKTTSLGSDEIFTVITDQIKDGTEKRIHNSYTEETERIFKPDQKWIQSEIYSGKNLEIEGFYFTFNNCIDLRKRIGKKRLNLVELREILRKKWKDIPTTEKFSVNGKTNQAIFIPKEYLND